MKPFVSVIIPAYNSEKYLKRAVESVLNQTFDSYEIIIVGSEDKTGKIAEKFAQENGNIVVIRKQNGGVSSARNSALNVAMGEFVSFLDADDVLHEDFLKELTQEAKKNNLDIVKCRMMRKGKKHSLIAETLIEEDTVIEKNEYDKKIFSYFGKGVTVDSSCFALIKTTIARSVKFDEKLVYGEDTVFMAKAVNQSKRIMYVSKPLYYYIYSENEATESFSDEKNIQNLIYLRNEMETNLSKFIKAKYIKRKYDDAIMNVVYLALQNKSYKDYKNFVEKMKNNKIGTNIAMFRKTWNFPGYLFVKMRYFAYKVVSDAKARLFVIMV